MKLKPIGSNQTEATEGDKTILYSYSQPVACLIHGDKYYRTTKKWSSTTSRHINKWLENCSPVQELDQEELEAKLGLSLSEQ